MKNGKYFIATKPLQIIVSLLLIEEESVEDCCVDIVDNFSDSLLVYKKIKEEYRRENVFFKNSKKRFFSFFNAIMGGYEAVYIDGDIGTRLWLYIAFFKILNRGSKLYVYEEGIGTYRDNIYPSNPKNIIKKHIFNIFGISTYFGGCNFTDGIFVFEKNKYLKTFPDYKKTVFHIKKRYEIFCEENLDFLKKIFCYDINSLEDVSSCNKVVLYLTSWSVDNNVVENIKSEYRNHIKIIKPHPHIKETLEFVDFNFVIPARIPAEILLIVLMKRYDEIIVFHHGSSVSHYIENNKIKYYEL